MLLRRNVALARRIDSPDLEANALHLLMTLELRQQQWAAAAATAQACIAVNEALGGLDEDAYTVLAEAQAQLGRWRAAYETSQRVVSLRDSVFSSERDATLAKLQTEFDTERKELRIRELKQRQRLQQEQANRQQQRLWALGAILVVVLLGLAVTALLYRRLQRSQAKIARQRDELAQARATQDRLYALIAHDLRSPVVAFTGLADLLNRYVVKGDTVRLAGLGGRIRQAAQSLSELLDNLLNWAVSQRGELVAQPRPLRAAALLADIAALYESAALAADVELRVEGEEGLLVQADEQMTRTILRNLAGNALKATPAGGRVVLRAERGGGAAAGQAVLRVVDSGPGLSAEALAQLNGPAPALRVAGRESGAGLGLLLSRAFAEAQRGSLVIAAAGGGGTEAAVRLPLAA